MKIVVINGQNHKGNTWNVANILAAKLSSEKAVRVGVKTRFLFWMMGGMQKADWGADPTEKDYWESKGWLKGAKPWK